MQLLIEWQGSRQAKEAGEVLDLDRTTYSRFAHGIRKPKFETAYHIERVTDGHVPAASWYEPAKAEKATTKRKRAA